MRCTRPTPLRPSIGSFPCEKEKTVSNQENRHHVREHGSLLAGPEKRLLVWMAERLPSRVSSDHLSLLGLSAMLVAGLAFWAASWNKLALVIVVAALVANWFGDSLDGTVARVRSQQRPRYGFYVDHVIDVVGTFFLIAGLGLSEFMSPAVALGLLVAYMMVSAESYLATHARGVFKMSFLRVGPTELRILLALGAMWLLYKPWVSLAGKRLMLFDVGGVVATVGLGVAFVVSAARNAKALYAAEPLPARETAPAAAPDDAIDTQPIDPDCLVPMPQPVPVVRRVRTPREKAVWLESRLHQ